MHLLSRAEEIILLAVFKLEKNAYGVTIREQVQNDIGRYWSFGVIYKTLKKMKSKGYVHRNPSDPLKERGGRTRYYYSVTPQGLKVLDEIRLVTSSIWRGIRNPSFEE